MGKRRRSSPRRPSTRAASARTYATPWSTTAGFAAVALVLLIPPFVVWRSLDEAFRLPKLYASELLVCLSLVLLAFRLGGGERRPWRLLRHRSVLATVPLVLVAILGWLLGEHSAVVRQALPSLILGCAALIGWSVGLDQRERWRLMTLATIPAVILASLAILQFHGLYEPLAVAANVSKRLRLTSLAGGAYDLAGYLVLPFLVLQARWPTAGRRERKVLGVALAVLAYALMVTRTLTTVSAVVVGGTLLAARQLPRRARRPVAAALVVGFAVVMLATPLGTRTGKKVTNLTQSGDWNRFFTGRLDGWRAAGWMFSQEPILGVGHGAFRSEFGTARLALQDRQVQFYRNHQQPYFIHAHSEPLNVAAEGGLAGLLAVAWALTFLVTSVRRHRRAVAPDPDTEDLADTPSDDTPFNDLWWPALAALTILAVAYFPFHIALQAFPWLLFLAAAFDAPRDPEPSTATWTERPISGRLLTPLVVLCLIALSAATAQRAWRGMARETTLTQLDAQAAMLWQQRDRVPARQREAALRTHMEILKRLQADAPSDVRLPMAMGGRYFLMGRYEAAERAYRAAAALETRAETYLNLARCLRATGDLRASADAARTVLRLDPRERRTLDALGLLPSKSAHPDAAGSAAADEERGHG